MRMCNCGQGTPLSFLDTKRVHRVAAGISLLLLLSLPSLSQDSATPDSTPLPVTVFGGGERTRLGYQGDQVPKNILMMSTGYEAAYDDNPLGQGPGEQADEEQSLANHASVLHQSPRMSANIDYQSSLQYFHHYTQFNRLNQNLTADEEITFNSYLSLRIRDDLVDQKGLYAPLSNVSSSSEIGSPTALNSTIYTPLNSVRANTARVDVLTQMSVRRSLDLFVGYATRTFAQAGTPSYGTTTQSVGAEYVWRANEHGSVGVLGAYERIALNGSLLQGTASRLQSGALLPTVGWKLRPTLEVNLYAGPQLIQQLDSNASASNAGSPNAQMEWTAGGGLTRVGRWLSAMLSAEHSVTDGGVLLSFVSNTGFSAGVRKRIYGAWDLTVDCGFARNRSLSPNQTSAWLTEQSGRAIITHPLGRKMALNVDYEYLEQTPHGDSSIGSGFHRNRIATSIAWNWGAIRMGH